MLKQPGPTLCQQWLHTCVCAGLDSGPELSVAGGLGTHSDSSEEVALLILPLLIQLG
jgi:hypothetical protein